MKPSTGVGAGGAVAGGARPSTQPARGGNAAAAVAGGMVGGAAADFLRGPQAGTLPANRPGAGAGTRPGVGPGNRLGQGAIAGNRPSRIENRGERQGNRQDRRNEIRDQVNNHPIRDFWGDHPLWGAWAITRPFRWASWSGMTGWGNYGWTDPSYYNYGENIYYEGDSVYYGDKPVATAAEYAEQAEAIATSAPPVAADKTEWMPLGVFAVTPDGQKTGPEPTLFLQLVLSKEGIINGTLTNTATNSTQQIEGMVDKKSQRTAWTVKGKDRPLMETGIYNLTENTAPALLHFADGQTQQWLLVRLDDPSAGK